VLGNSAPVTPMAIDEISLFTRRRTHKESSEMQMADEKFGSSGTGESVFSIKNFFQLCIELLVDEKQKGAKTRLIPAIFSLFPTNFEGLFSPKSF
jgi:hypothetical protein